MTEERRGGGGDTRTAILDVAERLVQSRGFNGFSYADVAAELGITKAALHYHFRGKAELGESLISRYAERFGEVLSAILAGRISVEEIASRKAPAAAPDPQTEVSGVAPSAIPASTAIPDPGAFAVIEYEDAGGRKRFQMTKEQIVVGRGGRDYWTDLKLETLPDVSREHFRLRRDPASGQFFLKDLSRLGTTINGDKVPSSIEFVDGEKRDRNVEAPVPEKARIGLANVVFLEFRSASNS